MQGAIVVSECGGPEVLQWVERDPGSPGPGEVLVRHTVVGLNFIDVYHRTGLYPQELPFTPGVEGTGVVEEIGAGVDNVSVGDRVAYTSNGPIGSYCEARVMAAWRVVRLPDEISNETAAAVMVKGCTVEYLVRRTYPVLGTEEKGELAREHGCDHIILYRDEDITERVREITDGAMCAVAYDSVGASTFEPCLESVAPRGMMVTFGNASGPVEPISPLMLAKQGSAFLTRPRVADYYATPEETADGIAALFGMITSGAITPHIGGRYALRDVAQAHRDLEARKTVGSNVLVV